MATKSIKAEISLDEKKGGKYTLMKGSYKPHTGAVKKKFRLQKRHRNA